MPAHPARTREPGGPDLPPGQHATAALPVVSAGKTPTIDLEQWQLTITTENVTRTWDWASFAALPRREFEADLHCVQGWSQLGGTWEGVPFRHLFSGMRTRGRYAAVRGYDGYLTTVPLEDLLEMPTWLAMTYEHQPLSPAHGGPVRLLVPHLYLWKSVKWVQSFVLTEHDLPGTRELEGLHPYGDPWLEQRRRDSPHTNSPTERHPER